MYGAAMGTLYVDILYNGNWTNLWSESGDQGDVWYTDTLDLSSYASLNAQIRFRGFTGTSYTSDMAIDAIEITYYTVAPMPNDAAVIGLLPEAICAGPNDVYAIVMNNGTNAIDTLTLNWSVNSVAQTPMVYTSSIAIGEMDTVLLGSYNFTMGPYDIQIVSSMPNNMPDPYPITDTFLVSGLYLSMNGTYTIGATGDYATFAAALSDVNANGICGPIVFNVESGTYTEQITLPEILGMSSTNTVTFQSATGVNTDVVVEYAATGTADNWVLAWTGGDYITVKNMTFKSTTTDTYGRVVEFRGGSNYNVLENCNIESIITTSSNATGIRSYTDGTDEYNLITGNHVKGAYYGIYWYGSSSDLEHGNQFIDNTIEDFYYYGFYNYYQYENTVDGNYVYQDPNGSTTCYPFYVAYCDGPIVVTNNKLFDDAGATFYGMRIYYCDADATAPGLVANNWVSSTGNTGTQYGLYLYYSNNINAYHNSVYITDGGTIYGAYVYGSSASGVYDFKNNSIVSLGTGGYCLYGTSSNLPGLTSGNNNLYTNSGNLCYFSTYYTLASWSAIYSTDTISTEGNYYGVDNLHSYSLLLNGTGTPLAEVTTDIDGETRDLVAPDIGADEFLVVNNDAGITALPGVNGLCAGPNDITARVTNYGLLPITSVIINWEVNGVLQTPYTLTTNIPVGTYADVVIGSYTLLNNVSHNFTAWTTMPNGTADLNTGNDSFTITGVLTSLSGNYTIGATGNFLNFTEAVAAVNTYGICGPVVFEVESGTYTEQVSLGQIPGVDAINTVTFKSATGVNTDVVLQYNASSTTDNWVVNLDGSDYFSFEDMTIKSLNGTYGRVVRLLSGAHHNSFIGNILEGPSASSTSTYMAVVVNESGVGDSMNVFSYNDILNGSYAMYMYGGSSASFEEGNVITHNNILNFYYYGVYLYYQYGTIVEYNTIESGQYSTHYPLYTYYVQGPFRIVGNKIHTWASSTNYGLRLYYCDGYPSTALVANNFVSTSVGTSTNYGMYVYYSSNINIYYNSVNVTNGTATSAACYVYEASAGGYGNIRFTNNSFVNTGGGYAMYIHDYAMSPGMVTYQDYNNYYATGSTPVLFGVWNVNTLADLNLIEPHSKMVDPAYVSVSDLHSYSALLSDAGKPLASVPFDIDMEPRSATTPNIGADEYTLYTNDAGMSSFVGIDAVCPGPTDVSALINNFGLVDLTQVTLNWTVNGVAQTPVMVYDTIPVGGNATIYLGNYTFLSGTVYDVYGWTSMPNGVVDLGTSNDSTMSLGLQTAAAGTFTIGATGDFATITDAQTFISNYGVCGPVIFNIQPGTYSEQVTIDEVSGVDATNTVTWQSSTGNNTDVIVEYAASGLGDDWVWMLDGADYQTVQNITIKSTYPTGSTIYGRVVYLDGGANYNTFHNCILEGVEGSSTSNYYAVVYNYSTSVDEYNTFSNNDILYGSYGVECYATSANQETGNQFLNNNIEGYYYYGMRLYYQYDVHAIGNTILQSPTGYTYNYALYSYYCDGALNISSNYIYDNGGTYFYALYINYPDATAAAPGLIANNMVASENITSTQYGIRVYNGMYQNIYNNSVSLRDGGTNYAAYIYLSNNTSYGPYNFANNNIANYGSGGYGLYCYGTGLPGITFSNNNYYSNSSSLCYASTTYNNISDWNMAAGGNDINVDPGYISTSDIHCNSIVIDGGGVPVAEVTVDIDGDLRDPVSPDIGADEFVLANDDAGISDLPGINALCPGLSDITATVANYGLVNLDSVVINWEVNGILQTPYTYATTIPVGGTADVVIGTYNLLSTGVYDFTVWTTLPNGNVDPNTGNDSLTVTGVTTSVYGTYTIGATGDFTTFADAVNFISAAGVCGPVIFNIETGVYTEQVNIPDIVGASATNTITFQPATGNVNDVTVQWTASGSTDNWVWRLGGVDWCTVQNITIKSNYASGTTSYARVLVVEGASTYNNVFNCILEGVVATGTSNANCVIYDYYSSGLNEYNTYQGNQILNGAYGLYSYGSGGAYGNKYIDNYIDGYYYYGLYTYYQFECEIIGNTILQNANGYTYNYATYIAYCDGPIKVMNNYIYDNVGTYFYGLRIYYCDATAAAPGLVANNMISSENITSSNYNIYFYNCMYTNFYNNSVRSNNPGTAYNYVYISSTTYGPMSFWNNSVATYGTSGYALYGTSTSLPLIDFKNNNLFTNTATLCSYSTAYSDIAAWNSAISGNDISVDPGYLSATDLHTFSLDLNASAVPVPEVTTDFDGDLRNPNFPDIGADEFDLLLPPNDLEVQIVYTLGQLPLGAGDNHEVSAIVKNVGADTQYNVPVTLTISGSNTFTNVLTIDSIMSAETDTITFAPFTATTLGLDDVTVTVPADSILTNNSASYLQEVTTNQIAYSDTSEIITNLGYNTGQGLFLCRYQINGAKVINAVGALIVGNNTPGSSLYGVVLDTNGIILSQSNPITITTIDSIYMFPILDPSATTVVNGDVLVGFAQTFGSAGYYPCGIQEEIPTRAGAYYTAGINGGSLTEETSFGRFTIGAVVGDPAPWDAACVAITGPGGGCGLTSSEYVTIEVQNYGANTIAGGLTVSYQLDNNTPVTETIPSSTVILSGGVYTYSFTTPVNLSVTALTTFNMTAWVNLTGDLNQNNDTSTTSFLSLYQPPDPVAINTTVLYGSMATLEVISPDSIVWYDDPLSVTPVANGTQLTVGPLYDTATMYAQATTNSFESGDLFTTMVAGNGSSGNMFDVTAYNTITIDSFYVNTSSSGIMEVWYRQGTYVGFTGSNAGWTLLGSANVINPGTNIPAILAVGGLEIPAGQTYGIYVTFVTGSVAYTNGTGTNEIYENNDMKIQCGYGGSYFSLTFTPRVWNGTIFYTSGVVGCTSNLVPVTANVVNIPPYDIGVVSAFSPNSGTNLSSTEVISVEIHNWGSSATSFFNISYDITGTTSSSVTEPMTVPIASGTSATFDFSSTVDFSAYGIYDICVFTQLNGDGFPSNDTLCFQVVNSPPVFCSSGATSTAYEEIVQVDLANMSNYSFPSNAVYTNFNNTVSPAILTLGNSHPITIISDYSPGYSTSYSCWVEVYIDWNNDAVFTEPGEIAFSSAILSSQTISGMLTVPPSATLGLHSMRVVLEQTTSAAGVLPCGTYSYGETEDYQVFIQPPYATDAGATAFLSPSGAMLENTSQPVRVIVYNFGTDTIFNMDVVYTVDGVNPVLTTYTGALPAFTQDTVSLGNMLVPGGYFDLCAYTILADDSSHINDTTCISLFADPQYDLAMLSIEAPLGGCGQGLEDVTVVFMNLGDTVFGNISVSYSEPGIPTSVTETYTGTMLPGDTVTYTFTVPIDLTVTSLDTFTITASVSYAGDPILSNNSLVIEVTSDVSPPAPTAYDIVIWAGTSGTLNVLNPDTNLHYEWFDASNNSLSTDTFFETPVLFDTTTFYVSAASGSAGSIALTEFNLGGNDYIEIQNMTGSQIDATGWVVAVSDNYTNINAVNTIYWNLGVMQGGEVLTKTDLASASNYWGNNLFWNPGAPPSFTGWAMIVDDEGNVVDFMAWGWTEAQIYAMNVTINGYAIDMTTAWIGNSMMSYPSEIISRINYDNDVVTDWVNSTTGSIGLPNPNMVISGGTGVSCASTLTPVTVFVQYADYDAALLNITSPVSASNLNNVPVAVDIYNNGLLPLHDFLVKYTVLGYSPVFETVTDTIMPGQMINFEFADSINASVFGTYDLCATTLVVNDGYTANDEFCTSFANWDGNGESCSTAFPYLMINEPPVYQTTVHPYDRQWWRFELPVDATNVDVSLCGSTFDTKLEVHSECPQTQFATAAYLGYNDNSCGQQSNVHFNMLSAGVYWAKVYGYQADYGDYVLEITGDLGDIAVVNFNVGQILCNGAANGSIITTVAPLIPPATLPLSYLWSNSSTDLNLYNLAPGTYTLTITDFMGIPQIETVTITEPPVLAVSLTATDATTFGGNDGSIVTTISGGTTPYTFMWSNDSVTQNLSTAYAGIYSLSVWDANGCTIEETVTVNSPVPWPAVTPTANSHLIIVDKYSTITLDNVNAAYGSLIGVFYNQNGTMVCGGWAYWSGMATSITAYGATPPMDNGYMPGENFTWKLYEAALNVEYGGPACYMPTYPNQGTYATGGFSGINCLNAQSIIFQPIELPAGWSIWSTYVDPIDPGMVDIFDSISSNVIIVKSGSGQIYWPLYNLNTIGSLVMGEGYQIKMTVTKMLHVQGLLLDPLLSPITIPGGWSIMGYLRTSPMNAATIMSPIVSQVVIVKSGGGQIYWPLYNLNTIGDMVPGQGYQIKMTSQQILTFPGNTSAPTKINVIDVRPEKYYKVTNTGHNMSLGILEDAWNVAPKEGDEIGVFNAQGDLIGSTVYHKGFNAVTIWGDDSHTKDVTEGIANGDVFTLKLWSYASDTEQELVVQSWLQGNDQYGRDAISVIEKLVVVDTDFDGFALFQNTPNPFRDATEISFYIPEANHIKLLVYNTLGELVEELVSAHFDAGKYSVTFETANLPSGTYFYKLISDNYTATKAMNIDR